MHPPIHDFGELRSLLHRAPSPAVWRRLQEGMLRALVHGPVEVERVWLPYALEHLESWPPLTRPASIPGRSTPAPGPWLRMCDDFDMLGATYDEARTMEALVCGWLRGVRRVHIHPSRSPERVIDALIAAPHGPRLSALEIGYFELDVERLERVLERFTGLESLSIAGTKIGGGGVAAIVSAPGALGLRELNLSDCALEDADVSALLDWAHGSSLRALTLGRNRLTDATLDRLERFLLEHPLEALSLESLPFGVERLERFVSSAALDGMKRLGLNMPTFEDSVAERLVQNPSTRSLERLNLERSWRLTDRAAHAIAASEHLSNLESIVLENTELTMTGILALLRSANLPSMVGLELQGTAMTENTGPHPPDESMPGDPMTLSFEEVSSSLALALANTRRMRATESLTIYDFAGDSHSCLRALLSTRAMLDVRALSLPHLDLEDPALTTLGDYPFTRLDALSLGTNAFGDDGLRALIEAPWFDALKTLNLGSWPSTRSMFFASRLADIGRPLALERLTLCVHEGTIGALVRLSASQWLPRLEYVNVMVARDRADSVRSALEREGHEIHASEYFYGEALTNLVWRPGR